MVPVFANVAGDFWNWIAGVFMQIGDVSIYWLVLALALKTAESALIALSWRNILHAAYPGGGLSFKTAWGASQGGTAINAVTPAQAGTATMIGIFRTSIPGSTVAGVASATVIQSLFFTAVSVLMVIVLAIVRPRSVSEGSPSNETGGFLASHPLLVPIVVVVAIAVVVLLWPRLKPRLLSFWHKAKQGAAIFRDRRRYARRWHCPRAPRSAAGSASTSFHGGVRHTGHLVHHFSRCVFHMLSQLFSITPGGVGQTQALDVATLRRYASSNDIAAFSITQDAVITLWNVVLGVAVMLWAFGFKQMRELLSKSRKQPQEESVV